MDKIIMLSFSELIEMIRPGKEKIKYYEDYNKLISDSLSRGLDKTKIKYYTEKHHILPKCMGGKDKENNFVLLKAGEHITAHILLAKCFPDNEWIVAAANIVCGNNSYRDRELLKEEELEYLEIARSISTGVNKMKVVCYNLQTFEVFGVYNSQHEAAQSTSFTNTSISNCILGVSNSVWGNGFSNYKIFENSHKDKLDEYFYKIENNIELTKISKRRKTGGHKRKNTGKREQEIVAVDEFSNVCAVLKSVNEIDKYGGNINTLYNVLVNKSKSTYGAYTWCFSENFKNKEELKIFIKRYGYNILLSDLQLGISKRKVAVVSIINNKPIKIYNTIQSASEDTGCDNSTISKCIRGLLKHCNSIKWEKLSDAMKNYPEECKKLLKYD